MEGIIIEDFIRDTVADKINNTYYKRKKFYIKTEGYTKENKRADVLFVFPYVRSKAYVVAIEAKSKKTLNALRFTDDEGKRLKISRWFISLTFITIVSLFYLNEYRYVLDGPTSWLIAIFFAVGTILVAEILKRVGFWFTKSIPVIDQLKKYPANEKWLAIGPDSISSKKDLKAIKKELEKRGIGLITVDSKGRVRYLLTPEVSYENVKNDYLAYYLYEGEIRDSLKGKSTIFFKTKAQKASITRKIIWGVFIIILLVMMLALTQESKYYRY